MNATINSAPQNFPRSANVLVKAFQAQLIFHVALLSVILVGILIAIAPLAAFTTDEGLAILQERQLDHTGHWTIAVPPKALDSTGDAAMMYHSDVGTKGRSFYSKHPFYPELLRPFDSIGHRPGLFASSMLGLLLTSIASFYLARVARLSTTEQRIVFWMTALASPLFFDGFIIFAHTLAAAFTTVAIASALAAVKGYRPRIALASLFIGSTLSILLRTEAALCCVGITVACVLRLRTERRWIVILTSGAAIGGSAIGYLINHFAALAILGSSAALPANGTGSSLTGHLVGAAWTMLAPGATLTTSRELLVLALLMTITAAVIHRRRPQRQIYCLPLGIAAIAYISASALGTSGFVPGLLIAFPIGTFGLFLLSRPTLAETSVAFLLEVVFASALMVFIFQYATGGGPEWGGRYFAFLVPALSVIVVRVIKKQHDSRNLKPLVSLLATMVISIDVIAVHTLSTTHHTSAHIESAVAKTLNQYESRSIEPTVIWQEQFRAQVIWNGMDTSHWLHANPIALETLVQRCHSANVTDLVVIATDPNEAQPLHNNGYIVSSSQDLGEGRWILTAARSAGS